MKTNRLLLLGLLSVTGFLCVSPIYAQKTGKITGVVKNQETGEPLAGTNVQIKNTFLGDVCDADGHFELSPLQRGVYTIKVSFIGYASKEVHIDLTQQSTIELMIGLFPSPIQMDQVIVTGSRQPEELSAAVASVNILEARDIQARNNYRIDEALVSVPGVTLVGENISVRGGSGYNRLGGSRILVLLDETPILTSDLATANWNIIPITAVDRIEVLKGAASSLYGSGGLTGVVNIITKNPCSQHCISFRQSSGIYDDPSISQWKWTDKTLYFHRTDIGYGNRFGALGIRFDLAHHYSTGDREMGEFQRWYFTGKANLRLPDYSTLTLFSTYSYENRDLFLRWIRQNNALNVPTTDRNNHFKLKGFVGYLVYQKLFSPTLSTKFRVSYNQQLLGIPFDLTTTFRPAIGLSGEVQANWLPHPDHSISMGVNYKRDQVESKYYGKREANAISPYIQEIWKVSRIWQLNAGLRYDTYTLVGDSVEMQLSPRIGASYQPWHGTIVHFSYGRGFRAASVVERFLSVDEGGDIRVIANPTLQPERSTLFDIGVRQSIGQSFFAEVTAFSSYYRNFIELTFIPQNFSVQFLSYPRAQISGIESSLQWQICADRLGLNASATWMDPRDVENDEPLPYRPQFIAFVTPSLRYGPFTFAADFRYASRLERVLVYPKDELVATKVWNLRFSYSWCQFTFKFLVNNAVNYNYTISERVLGEIRNFAISIQGDL